jgi:FixJ family two-component response regulator
MDRSEHSRPICYVAVRNEDIRSKLSSELAQAGWEVVIEPTGVDLLADLSGCILGDQPKPVGMVIVEDKLPGCRGTSIAQGLAELGIDIPVKVIDPPTPVPELRLAS